VKLIVYSRKDCHLCCDMIATLIELQAQFPFSFRVIDIDSDLILAENYGELVPVLTAEKEEICHHRLDLVALDAYFAKLR